MVTFFRILFRVLGIVAGIALFAVLVSLRDDRHRSQHPHSERD
jgi:hypothetical protein